MLEPVFLSCSCWAMWQESAVPYYGGGGAKEKQGKLTWSTGRGSKISHKGSYQM